MYLLLWTAWTDDLTLSNSLFQSIWHVPTINREGMGSTREGMESTVRFLNPGLLVQCIDDVQARRARRRRTHTHRELSAQGCAGSRGCLLWSGGRPPGGARRRPRGRDRRRPSYVFPSSSRNRLRVTQELWSCEPLDDIGDNSRTKSKTLRRTGRRSSDGTSTRDGG
jgi:hypothetical protein